MSENNLSYDLSPDGDGLSSAVVTMTLANGGVIEWRFYPGKAPKTVERIAHLVASGFYNGLTFHRVVPGFVVQGGDPTGTGTGGSGKNIKAEFNDIKHTEGILSMARSQDPDSADSQFFILLDTHPHLDGSYTAFGKVITGMEHVHKISESDKIEAVVIK